MTVIVELWFVSYLVDALRCQNDKVCVLEIAGTFSDARVDFGTLLSLLVVV